MSDGIAVQVLLFARFAELLGTERLEVRVSAPARVRDVVARVAELAGGSGLGAAPLVARDLVQVGLDEPVAPGDELALLPPLSGG